jgi:hypothetical protein
LLVPIFVPTMDDGNTNRRDFGKYRVFNPNSGKFKIVNDESANKWYTSFRELMDTKKNPDETHYLWLDKASLANMRCELSKTPTVTDFNIWWGAYEASTRFRTRTEHLGGKLTLMFYVPDAPKRLRKMAQAAYDTAVPCPPGQNCDSGNELEYDPLKK